MPDDPIGEILGSAIALHQTMMTWVEAGFSPEQAFGLLQTVVQAQIMADAMRGGIGDQGP